MAQKTPLKFLFNIVTRFTNQIQTEWLIKLRSTEAYHVVQCFQMQNLFKVNIFANNLLWRESAEIRGKGFSRVEGAVAQSYIRKQAGTGPIRKLR